MRIATFLSDFLAEETTFSNDSCAGKWICRSAVIIPLPAPYILFRTKRVGGNGMFVVTLNKTSLKKVGAGALCCALVIFSAFLGRYISTRTVAAAAGVNRIESAQDIQT